MIRLVLLAFVLAFIHPESAVETSGKIFVSDIGKFGVQDGRLLVKTVKGWSTVASRLLDPKGIAVLNDSVLLVTDVQQVRAVTLKGKVTDIFPANAFPKNKKPKFLNDITIGPDGMAYFSDTKQNAVFVGDPESGKVKLLFEVNSPNGVAFGSDSTLYVVTFEEPGRVYSFKNGNLKLIFSSHDIDGGDGLAVTPDGDLLISGFLSGKIVVLNPTTGKHRVLKDNLTTPADISLSPDGKTIYVPLLNAGKLITVKLNR